MASSSSSSSSKWKYAAFISFRGEDTRDNFTSHLRCGLRNKGINFFIDNELHRGAEIRQSIVEAIRDSMTSIIVFSKNYAASSYCLDELLKIIECKREFNQTVVPVFYGVDPSDVHDLTGEFGNQFYALDARLKDECYKSGSWRVSLFKSANISPQFSAITSHLLKHKERVLRWRIALQEASELAGLVSSVIRDESELIGKIIQEVSRHLCRTFPSAGKGLVGMEYRVKAVTGMLSVDSDDAVITVGICGIGGLGKTTIAKVVYDTIHWNFEGSCFLANIRENFARHGGPCFLQEQLISETAEAVKIWNAERGVNELKNRLRGKRVLLVLDDVDNLKQLEMLAADNNWFGQGSRIIITSRDEHLLQAYGVNDLYKPDALSPDEALTLFCLKAFKKAQPEEGYAMLSNLVVEYASGIPLVLKILGSFLHGRGLVVWESALRKLHDISDREIMDVLLVSYNGLDELEKTIFLDIACFFKGMDKDRVTRILNSFGLHSEIGIQILIDKSLITVSSNKLWMHDLLQMLAWETIHQESREDPGKRSRLWKYDDVHALMINRKHSDTVEGISLEVPRTGEQWDVNAFTNMTRLRLLMIRNGHFARRLITLPNALQFLEWHGYPSASLPSCFQPYKLVELDLSHSNIKELWHETQQTLLTLKAINLSHSRNLMKTPNFTRIPNMEVLKFKGCTTLSEVHPSIGHLKKLEYLNMAGCMKVKMFPTINEHMDCLQELHLDKTSIEELSDSVRLLSGLHVLSLKGCKDLLGLPSSISTLTSLKRLYLSGCSRIASIPDYSVLKETLEHIDIRGTAIIPSLWLSHRKEVDGKVLSLPSSLGICSLMLILQKSSEGIREVAMVLACFSLLAHLQPMQQLPVLPPLPKLRHYQLHRSLATTLKLQLKTTQNRRECGNNAMRNGINLISNQNTGLVTSSMSQDELSCCVHVFVDKPSVNT